MKPATVLLLVVAAGAFAACSAPDPGAVDYTINPRPRTDAGTGGPGPDDNTDGGDPTGGGGTDAGGDAGPGDGGGDGGPAGNVTAFSGAPAFAYTAPAVQSATRHGGNSNAGQNCLGCHTGQGAPEFVFAGTAYRDTGGTMPATQVEVRVVTPQGQEVGKAYTDNSGNFWIEPGAIAQIPAGAKTGARNGTTTKLMVGGISNGACNTAGCHAPNAIRIVIP